MELTDRQLELASKLTTLNRKFVVNLVGTNKSQRQAYIDAGGKAKSDDAQDAAASRMLADVKVKAFYDSLMESATSEAILTREEALQILSNNAKVQMTDVAVFGLARVGEDAEGNDVMQTVWTMKDSKDIDPNVMSCIKSVTMTKQGPKIELHDQHGAIKQLSDMQGWNAPKKSELTGAGGKPLAIQADVSSPEVASALAGLMDKL